MSAQRFSMSDNTTGTQFEDLRALKQDLKRMLRVQMKEFIHFIDDAQVEVPISLHPYTMIPRDVA